MRKNTKKRVHRISYYLNDDEYKILLTKMRATEEGRTQDGNINPAIYSRIKLIGENS